MGVFIIDLVWCSGRRAEMKWEVLKIKLKPKQIKRVIMEILFVGGNSPRRPWRHFIPPSPTGCCWLTYAEKTDLSPDPGQSRGSHCTSTTASSMTEATEDVSECNNKRSRNVANGQFIQTGIKVVKRYKKYWRFSRLLGQTTTKQV